MSKEVGVFRTRQDAEMAVDRLKESGYVAEDISIITRHDKEWDRARTGDGDKTEEGAATGAAIGGGAGLLAGLGLLAVPGVGPFLAAGPIAAAISGAVVGAGAGGIVGGLVGAGIPEDDAKTYNDYVDQGNVLVMVDVDDDKTSIVQEVFRASSAVNYMGRDPRDGTDRFNLPENRTNYDQTIL